MPSLHPQHSALSAETPAFTVLIPAYNEQGAILETLAKLEGVLGPGGDFEIMVINDGSTDDTQSLLVENQHRYPHLTLVEHERNRGYGAALKTGLRRARADIIAIIDADGTYPIEDLPKLVDLRARQHNDMVVGARTADGVVYPLIRKIPKVFLVAYASWVAQQRIPDMNSGMRVFRKDVASRFLNIYPEGFSFTTTITLAMLTKHYSVHYEPITYHARVGQSKIRPIRDTLNFVKIIARTGMYFAPLRVLMPIAGLLLLGAFFLLGLDLYNQDLTEKTLLLFLFALNTLMFGLIADMIDKRADG